MLKPPVTSYKTHDAEFKNSHTPISMTKKINRILGLILVAFLTILFRAWHLGVVQKDHLALEAQKPKSKTILVRADRGPIYDRFQIPLAINRICYNASIYYNQITQVPATRKVEEGGNIRRIFPRKEYIRSLAEKLGEELEMDPERIEDLIHAKASLFPHAPYVLKSRITEEQYYRLKALERDWPGLYAEIGGERFYPMGKTGCHVIGMMGAISQKKYAEMAEELGMLKEITSLLEQGEAAILPKGYTSIAQVYQRLYLLKEKAYALSDHVGIGGIEAQFEEELRGFFGKKIFETDQKGRLLRELPGGKEPIAGRKLTLSISAELQQFAEELLIKNEEDLDLRMKEKKPWIRGGAIVALDPATGEVLALASVPRFDPNDFIQKKRERLCEWLENEAYARNVWNGYTPLSKEKIQRRIFNEEMFLNWGVYLQMILPKESPLTIFFQKVDTIKSAIEVQEDFAKLHYLAKSSEPLQTAKLFNQKIGDVEGGQHPFRRLSLLLSPLDPLDRLFVIDLCRLIVDSTRFSDDLIEKIGALKLEEYRTLSMEWYALERKVKEEERVRFHKGPFAIWREQHQKSFLAEIRKEEKRKKIYAKPYLDHLDRKEQELFAEFWEENGTLITLQKAAEITLRLKNLSLELSLEFCKTFRDFNKLSRPLLGKYRNCKTEKELASAWLPKGGFGRTRSYAFQTTAAQGSVFKLITAYEGLKQGHAPILIDHRSKDPKAVAYTLSGKPYPRLYKGGRLPRSSVQQIGKIDLIGALEQSSNPYFSILAGDLFSDPEDLKKAAQLFGYGEKSGIELPGEAAGNLPNDLKTNRTGLYAFAIGQHTLLSTPLQSAQALSALANGGKLFRPTIVKNVQGHSPDRQELSPFESKNCFAEKELKTVGIPFALFTGVQKKEPLFQEQMVQGPLKKEIPISHATRAQILEGMNRTIWGEKGRARPNAIRLLKTNPLLTPDFLSLRHQFVGKTGTAQVLHAFSQNPSCKAEMITHTWFGAISFTGPQGEKCYETPELIVVVFSRFADSGKESAPLAAQMVKKWREIKKKHKLTG